MNGQYRQIGILHIISVEQPGLIFCCGGEKERGVQEFKKNHFRQVFGALVVKRDYD